MRALALVLLSACACACLSAAASSPPLSEAYPSRGFSITNFSSPSSREMVSLVTSSAITPQGRLLISAAKPQSMGQAWVPVDPHLRTFEHTGARVSSSEEASAAARNPNLVEVRGFRTKFAFELDGGAGLAGEGFAFVLQSESSAAIGSIGGGLGYGSVSSDLSGGIPRSLAVEFDTNRNLDLLDPSPNHISIHTTFGSSRNSANESFSLNSTSAIPVLHGTGLHSAEIVYEPPLAGKEGYGYLTVRLNEFSAPSVSAKMRLEHNISLIDSRYAYVGFAAATKSSNEYVQTIVNWTFEFLGRPSPPLSHATGDGMRSAQAGVSSIFVLQAVDQYGNNMSTDFGADFTATLSTQSTLPISINYTANGQFTCSYTPTRAHESAPLHVLLNGIEISGSPFSVDIIPGEFSPSHCLAFDGPSQTGLSANGSAGEQRSFSVQMRDQFDNDISTSVPTQVVAIITNLASQTDLPAINGQEDEPGVFTLNYKLEKADAYRITIRAGGTIIFNPTHDVVVLPAAVFGPTCVAADATAPAIAGMPQRFEVQLRDRFANNITNVADWKAINLVAEISGPDDSAKGTVSYSGLGIFVVSYVLQVSGDAYSLSVRVDGSQISGSPFSTKVFPENTVSPAQSTAVGQELQATRAGISNFVVQLRDPHGNALTTDHSNLAWTVAQSEVSPGFARAGAPQFYFNVSYKGAGEYLVDYFQPLASQFSTSVLINRTEIRDSPFQTTIVPAVVDGKLCTATGEGLTKTMTDHGASFVVMTRDRFSNIIKVSSGAVMTGKLALSQSDVTVDVTFTDKQDGTYVGSYMITTSGQYSLSVSVADVPIHGSPFTVKGEWKGLDAGQVVGIGVGVAAVIGLALGGFILYRTKFSKRSKYVSIRDVQTRKV